MGFLIATLVVMWFCVYLWFVWEFVLAEENELMWLLCITGWAILTAGTMVEILRVLNGQA